MKVVVKQVCKCRYTLLAIKYTLCVFSSPSCIQSLERSLVPCVTIQVSGGEP